MSVELQALFAAAVIMLILIGVEGAARTAAHGVGYGLGPRDEARDPTTLLGRASRAAANHIQGMAVFVPLVVVAELADISTPLTAWGAGLFAAARAVYAVIYLLGVPVLRTLVWGVGMAGVVMIGVEIVRFGF